MSSRGKDFIWSLQCRNPWSSQGSQHKACCQWCVFHSMRDFHRASGRRASPRSSSGTGSNVPLKEKHRIDAHHKLNSPILGGGSWLLILRCIRCFSNPYPATVHWNPAGSWTWRGGRHTTRAEADFTAQPPSVLLILNRAEIQRKTQM